LKLFSNLNAPINFSGDSDDVFSPFSDCAESDACAGSSQSTDLRESCAGVSHRASRTSSYPHCN
jgi:hypothetical protein